MARRGRVVVAMSGGVDSSTAGCLLREQGYEVIGLFLRAELTGTDAEDARHVARHLGIQFAVVDCTDEFDWLIDHFCAEYARGRTPNPCVRCNAELKFAKLLEVADELQAEQVATGHYARVEQLGRRWALRRGVDGEKDQSYFLSRLNQEQLARALFPLGELTKAEVRATAEAAGLPVHEKAESQDICFVVRPFDLAQDRPFDRARDRPLDSLGGKGLKPLVPPLWEGGVTRGDYRELLEERLGPSEPGPLMDVDGQVLGEHRGCRHFTVGQRRGLGVARGEPYYVVAIEAETNTVVVGPEPALYARLCYVRGMVWGAMEGLRLPRAAQVQIRYQHEAAGAIICPSGVDEVGVQFAEAQRAITPGQAAVFYDGDVVLGGGWIDRAVRDF